jgi:serine phosphatase RsbU (regulator of sigma subunit)
MLPVARYRCEERTLDSPSRLFLFSDGVYEVTRPDGSMLDYEAFEAAITQAVPEGVSELDELLRFAREARGGEVLEDDFSIVKMTV